MSVSIPLADFCRRLNCPVLLLQPYKRDSHIPPRKKSEQLSGKMIKEAILSTMWMGYGEDGILRIRMIEGASVEVDDIKLQYETIKRLTDKKRLAFLLDARANFTTSKAAHEYLVQQSADRIATAVITSNSISKAIVNTYITVFKPASPYKMFTNEEAAIKWLKEQMAKENAK